jgi:site-specific DNA-adenine methylase
LVKEAFVGICYDLGFNIHLEFRHVENRGKETNMLISLTDFKAKMNKSKINKYKINNNNKTNTKHEFNVKYERYKQDISKANLVKEASVCIF